MSDAAVKEEKRVAFTEKMKVEMSGLDFSQLQSDESFGDIVASLDGWMELSGPEKKERSVSLFGQACQTKGYKLASKYRLLKVGGALHVLTKAGGEVETTDGGGGGMEGTLSSAGGPKRLVQEGAMFDVLWDEHVVAGGHCKGRKFEARVKAKYVGIPRCLNPAPSHPTPPCPTPSHPTLLPSPHSTPISLPSLSHPSPIPLLSHPTLDGCSRRLSRVAAAARAELHANQSRWLGPIHFRRRRCRRRLSRCYQAAGHGLSTKRLATLTTCMLRAATRCGIAPRNAYRPPHHQRSRRQR